MSKADKVLASATRLRLRSIVFVLPFIIHSRKSARQARESEGNGGVELRRTKGLASWTLTPWKSRRDTEAFRITGTHQRIMAKLQW